MKTALLLSFLLVPFSIFQGCGNNNGGSQPVTEEWLEAVPAVVEASPSDGEPIGYGIRYPQEVPIIQCPNNPSGPGVIICHYPPANLAAFHSICIEWANLSQHQTHQADYLGPCRRD